MKYLVNILFLFLLVCTSTQAAQLSYVSSKKIKLYQQPNYQSETISQLRKGDELEVIKYNDKWVKVKHKALQGWVPKFSISETRPRTEKLSFLTRLKLFFSNDSRRARVTTVSTAGGVRGLAEEDTENSGNKDFEALQKMEQMSVSEQEVEQFQEGNQH